MRSSLLPNDIQDIEGLELKEQVKVIKEYIEYMREQLQWYSGVTDRAEGEYVQGITTYYGKSNSPNTPPSQWSTEAPTISDGEYLWQYTKVTRSGITTRSDPVCVSSASDGEDAALIYIHSSNGTIFRADNTGTVLTVTIYYGSDAIRTLANLQTAFGSAAHLEWYEQAYGSSTYTQITDSRISDNGFTLTLTSSDVADRATYNCRLLVSASEVRSQSSITITDIEDGQLLYATSSTAASTAAKTATLQSGTLDLQAGATVAVTFANANTAANPTLNIDGTGAKTIRAGNASLAASSIYNWTDNATVIFIYDGTYWQMDGTAQLEKADDARRVATDYISDIPNDDGIDVTGNNATSKVRIGDTVQVVADATHYTEVTDSSFDIYAGRAKPVATVKSYTSGTETYSVMGFSDYDGDNSLVVIGARTVDDGYDYGLIRTYDPDGHGLTYTGVASSNDVPVGGATIWYSLANNTTAAWIRSYADGRGELILRYGSNPNYNMSVLGRVTISNASGTVVNDEPALVLYDSSGNIKSAYALTAAYINAGTYAGFAAHGITVAHRYAFDWSSIGGYNYLRFYVDGTEVYRLQQQSYSDRRVKSDIEPIKDGYKEAVAAVDIDQFRYEFNDAVRQGGNGIMFGIVAQDLIKKLDENGIDYERTPLVANLDNEEESLYSVDYTQFLLARLAADEDRIKELETRLEALERR